MTVQTNNNSRAKILAEKQFAIGPSDLQMLEQRILYSASPIHLNAVDDLNDTLADLQLIAPLSEIGGEVVKLTDVVVGEDHNNTQIDLDAEFDIEEPILNIEILNISNANLFDSTSINGSNLIVDYGNDESGTSEILLRAFTADSFVDGVVSVNVLPVNDRPTAQGFADINLQAGEGVATIDLFAAFDDLEDSDEQLTFEVTEIENPELFGAVEFDTETGILTFEIAADQYGTSDVTIRATDTEGLSVEISTADADLIVYDHLGGIPGVHYPENEQLGEIRLLTSGAFFDLVDGDYDYTQFNEAKFRSVLQGISNNGQPIVLDIENEYYDNSPEGRDRLAEILLVFEDERPDLASVGYYRLLPERNWHTPIRWFRAQEDTDLNVLTTYSRSDRFAQYETNNQEWLGRNAAYRDSPTSFGDSVADHVTQINASLYTSYRIGFNSTLAPLLFGATADANSNTLSVPDTTIADGMSVRLRRALDASVPGGTQELQEYFVVNSDGTTFQLALSADGEPIDLTSSGDGEIFVSTQSEYLFHDPSVVYWSEYASANIAEANKFDLPVNAWLSPSFSGSGFEFIGKNFFRLQLDTLHELGVDAITLWSKSTPTAETALLENRGWWEAVDEFVDYINTPTQFTISVERPDAISVEAIPNQIISVTNPFLQFDLPDYFDTDDGTLTYSLSHSNSSILNGVVIDENTGNAQLSFSSSNLGSASITAMAELPSGVISATTFEVVYARIFQPAAAAESAFQDIESGQVYLELKSHFAEADDEQIVEDESWVYSTLVSQRFGDADFRWQGSPDTSPPSRNSI